MPRQGIALVLVLMVLLLIDVMAAGILTLATNARLVSASQSRALRAQAAAQQGVQSVLSGWERGGFDTLPVGVEVAAFSGQGAVGDLAYSTTVEHVLPGTYVVRGQARVGGANAFAVGRAVAGARTLDRAAILDESNAALIGGGPTVVAGNAHITAAEQTLPPEWTDSLCPGTDPLPLPFTMRTARPALVAPSATITEPTSVDSSLTVMDSIALGGVKWSEIAGIADRIEAGTVRPAPVQSGGRCETDVAGNWGDPLTPAGPCGRYFPLIYARGDVVVNGGTGQGLLIVAGTVTMAGNVLFVGLIVARDGISMDSGTRVYGSLRSKSGYALIDGAEIEYSRCALARALVNTSSAHRLILQQRRFIRGY